MQKNLKGRRLVHLLRVSISECRFSYVLQLDGYINVTALSDFYEDGRSTNQSLECVYQVIILELCTLTVLSDSGSQLVKSCHLHREV